MITAEIIVTVYLGPFIGEIPDHSVLRQVSPGNKVFDRFGPTRNVHIGIGLQGIWFKDDIVPVYIRVPVGILSGTKQLQVLLGKLGEQPVVTRSEEHTSEITSLMS